MLEIHLAAKRIGLKITDQFVEPVVQHLPLPVGKALAGGKVDQELGEEVDEVALLALEGLDLGLKALIDGAMLERLFVQLGLLLLQRLPLAMEQVERRVAGGACRLLAVGRFFAARFAKRHPGRLLRA
ncbi:hypothetical protein [Aeromonas salmonicida]|uniref:hypothetical protein n=1 Tax=Aeromonas salmonicida TaxID=645 RepID=UPI0022408E8C|nr:hypothetical protein [Aeromonas salmonicida]